MPPVGRPVWADIDLGAIAHNVTELKRIVAPALLCVVVKADAYGHGATEVSRVARAAGADLLAVAMAEEGAALRQEGIGAPIMVLSETPSDVVATALGNALQPTVYSATGVADLAAHVRGHRVVSTTGPIHPAHLPVHLKVDTGMHRVGASPDDTLGLTRAIEGAPGLELASLWTHCAVADEPDDPFTGEQLARFDKVVAELDAAGLRPPLEHPADPAAALAYPSPKYGLVRRTPLLHAANSAAALAHPASRLDMVRCGIAVYGIAPSPALAGTADLRPALSLSAKVSFVKTVAAGERLSYGLTYRCERDSVIATVPIGYADGVRRRLSVVGGQVLIGGRRRPIAGTITMDQILVDCGDDASVRPGDDVVLIGEQGGQRITAEDWAEKLDTIGYEIVCGIGPRVPRRYHLPDGPEGFGQLSGRSP